MEWPRITLFGDSITRRSTDPDNGCWGSMIAYKTGSYFNLDPRGFEGYNSKWALELMPKLFPKSYLDKVELFVLFFGHNDAWDKRMPMHVPLDQYNANMRAIIDYLQQNGLDKKKLILITPTWYHDQDFQEFLKTAGLPPTSKSMDEARKYSEIVKQIGSDLSIDVVDFFGPSSVYEPLQDMFCDGVHYSRKGAKMLFDLLMPVIERKLEAQYGKPLADMWHVVPVDQHPEVMPAIEAHMKAAKAAKQ